MNYLSQVDAQLQKAGHFLAHAELEEENWPYCGHLLAQALEHATCAVFIAWGELHAAEKKMHRFFDERLAPHMDPAMTRLVQLVWEREGQGRPDAPVEQLLAAWRQAIDDFAMVTASTPPTGWESLPTVERLGWDGLSVEERQLQKGQRR